MGGIRGWVEFADGWNSQIGWNSQMGGISSWVGAPVGLGRGRGGTFTAIASSENYTMTML